ncbi:MAG: HTH-type transcriptional regulator/antitoxin HigA [Porticoccaceae bacterium]|jgi:HTH-type transcriptional regulator/antitoxin HigA
MSYAALKKSAQHLSDQAGFIVEIANEEDYAQALSLMDELVDDYDNHLVLIELLSASIGRWESLSPEFTQFNNRISSGDHGVSLLRLLMDQHKLGVADLPEIGSKSLVSKILNERDRQLTKQHIDALSRRFSISPALFFAA